jgi:hypothetical protein
VKIRLGVADVRADDFGRPARDPIDSLVGQLFRGGATILANTESDKNTSHSVAVSPNPRFVP